MFIRSHHFLITTALLWPGNAIALSDAGEASSAAVRAPVLSISAASRDHVAVDVHSDGTIWVRGRTYKASFGREGARYVPFLGSQAPRNFPLDLDVARVSIDGDDLAFESAVEAVFDAATQSISFDRGAFTERYLLLPDSVEQTFVFDELPRRGEIVVTVDVESDLERRSDAAGFRFENEHGHVNYGRAFVFDASGRKDAIESHLEESAISIRVPTARVGAAALPLTIDPVLSTFSVRDTPIDEFAADTAYDETNGAYLTVFEEVFSVQDHDVRAVRHSPSGGSVEWQWIDISNANWRTPAVANVNAVDQFLVVAAVGAPPGREIQARTIAANSMAASAVFPISIAAELGDKYGPDVGGDPSEFLPAHYYVVWETGYAGGDRDIHGRMVNTGGGLVGLGTQLVSTVVPNVDGNPAISPSNGDVGAGSKHWNVVFEREVAPGNHDIWCRLITAGGALLPGPAVVAASALDERNPSCTAGLEIAPGETPWLAAYQVATATNGWDVRARVFEGQVLQSTLELSGQFATNSLQQTEPVCDTNGQNFVVAYLEQGVLGFGTTDIRLSSLYWSGSSMLVVEGNLSVSPGLEVDLRPALCAAHSGGADSQHFLVAFDRDMGLDHDVLATGYTMPIGGPVEALCFGDGSGIACPCNTLATAGRGCPNSANASGARLHAAGDASLAAGNFTLTTDGMPPATFALFFQGTSQVNGGNGTAFGDGLLCVSGSLIRLGTKPTLGGIASYPAFGDVSIVERGLVGVGVTRYYQAQYRDALAFCTSGTARFTRVT